MYMLKAGGSRPKYERSCPADIGPQEPGGLEPLVVEEGSHRLRRAEPECLMPVPIRQE